MNLYHGIIGWSNWRGGCEFYEDTTTIVQMGECSSCEGSGKAAPGTTVNGEPVTECPRCDGTGARQAPNMPRWMPRKGTHDDKTPSGRLLTDDMGDPEGARVLVLEFPRSTDRDELDALAARIEEMVSAEEAEALDE